MSRRSIATFQAVEESREESSRGSAKEAPTTALRIKWTRTYKEALEHDIWGQVVEAREGYTRLKQTLEQAPSKYTLASLDMMTIGKIVVCLTARLNGLDEVVGKPGLHVEQMKSLISVFENLFESRGRDPTFPIDLSLFQSEITKREDLKALSVGRPVYQGGSLLPPPDIPIGQRGIIFHLEKIGLKDATKLIDTSIMVHFIDSNGKTIESGQETPNAKSKNEFYINFGVSVYIQTPYEKLPKDFTMFLEIRHYSSWYRKKVTHSWAMLERDELKEGAVTLEIYDKPVDFKKQYISLLHEDELYMHGRVELISGICDSSANLEHYTRQKMRAAGIDPDTGLPLDPKTVTFKK